MKLTLCLGAKIDGGEKLGEETNFPSDCLEVCTLKVRKRLRIEIYFVLKWREVFLSCEMEGNWKESKKCF